MVLSRGGSRSQVGSWSHSPQSCCSTSFGLAGHVLIPDGHSALTSPPVPAPAPAQLAGTHGMLRGAAATWDGKVRFSSNKTNQTNPQRKVSCLAIMRTKRSIPRASTGLHQSLPTAPTQTGVVDPRAQLSLGPQKLRARWPHVSIHAFECLAPHRSRTSWDTQHCFLCILPQGKEEMLLPSPSLC